MHAAKLLYGLVRIAGRGVAGESSPQNVLVCFHEVEKLVHFLPSRPAAVNGENRSNVTIL
jgi:hypothetical protein